MGTWKKKSGKYSLTHEGKAIIIRPEKNGDEMTGKFKIIRKSNGVRGFEYHTIGTRASLEAAKNLGERDLLGKKNK